MWTHITIFLVSFENQALRPWIRSQFSFNRPRTPLPGKQQNTQSLLRILIQTNGALSTGKTGLVHVKVGGYYCSWASEIVLFVVVFFTQEQDYLACKNKQF